MLRTKHICRKLHFSNYYARYLSSTTQSIPKNLKLEDLPKYNSDLVESGWYKWWEENNFFNHSSSTDKFVMVLPPPNVTGSLHIGHALTCTIQDVIARWHRMSGKDVVWIPGCDHAGIATQGIVEKHLWNTQQLTRHQLGREKFINEVWKWCYDKEITIYRQLRRMGASLDWPKSVFTIDQDMSNAVTETFIRLHDAGLIYRSNSIINWCCELQSVISDIEVEHQEITGPTSVSVPGYSQPITFGKIYNISYPITKTNEYLQVSTTRPETMLGDTALMVHPDDSRYTHYHNKSAFNVFRKESIPIICDTSVNPNLGTGVVKVTPGHSHADYAVGLHHGLPILTVMNDDGTINEQGGEFKGQARFTARDNLIKQLSELGLYVGCQDHKMMLPRCSRTQDIIEPLLKPQWFLKTKYMVNKAKEAVENKNLKLHPKYQENVWLEWVKNDNIDWCISRQLWWGHRIPVYQVFLKDGSSTYVAANSINEARTKILKTGCEEKKITGIKQDEDVLDTWFSSGLFPFATLGWPRDSEQFKTYYPTSLLVTGRDILFFWVIRMVMLGQQLTGELPFKEVFAHGLVFDAEGKKMSKSKGNVIDPMDIITPGDLKDIDEYKSYNKKLTKCGADALRLSLSNLDIKEEVLKLDIKSLETNANFMNKIWNAFQFFLKYQRDTPKSLAYLELVKLDQKSKLSLMDRWILSRLAVTIEEVHNNFKSYDINYVAKSLHSFWYQNLCDVYLEAVKPILQNNQDSENKYLGFTTLWTCLHEGLVLFSPVIPYITEELYQYLPHRNSKEKSIMQCTYPDPLKMTWCIDRDLESLIDKCLLIAQSIKYLKASYNLQSSKNIASTILTDDETLLTGTCEEQLKRLIITLSRTSRLYLNSKKSNNIPTNSITIPVSTSTTVCLHLEGVLDIEKELSRLEEKLASMRIKEAKLLTELIKKKTNKHKKIKQEQLRGKIEQIEDMITTLKNL